MSRLRLLLPLVFACTPAELPVNNGEVVETEVTGVAAHGDDGVAPNGVIVRAINDLGVAVGGGSVMLTVDGAPVEVAIDAFGYGTYSVPDVGTVTVDGVGDGLLHATEEAWPGPRLPPAERGVGTPGQLLPTRAGALVAIGAEAVWTGPGLPTHSVARLETTIDGIATLQIDGDGVLDAIVWGGEVVVLLKGRPAGGFGWGAGIRAIGWSAEAAGAGDIDDDGDADLVIGWTGPGGDVIQFWDGDGLWGFKPSHERGLNGAPVDLALGRDAYDGSTVATVLTDGVPWQRFVQTNTGGYLVSGPTLDVGATQGWRIFGGADINGNGIDDLVVMPPRVAAAVREATIWDLSGTNANQLDVQELGAHFALGDANGDGLRNLWTLEDSERALRILTWIETSYLVRDAGLMPHFGAMSVADIDDDGVQDLLIAAEDWAWHPGSIDAEDNDRWVPAASPFSLYDFSLVGPVAPIQTGAGAEELVGVTSGGEGTRLTHWGIADSGPVVAEHVPIDVAGASGVALAVCGDHAWALLTNRLIEVDGGAAEVRGSRSVSEHRGVACGAGPEGATAALLDGADLVLLGADLAELEVRDGTGAVDVALVDRGSGAEVVTCDKPCSTFGWRDDGPGSIVAWDDDAVSIDGEAVLPGASEVTVHDVDGDARPDLVMRASGGWIGVMRSTGSGLAPARWWHADPDWTGAPAAGGSPAHPGAIWLRSDDLLVRTE